MADAVDNCHGPLGQTVDAPEDYAPSVLFPIPRSRGRDLLGLAQGAPLPFVGEDVWNGYELSWLNASGVPQRATLVLRIPCTTPNVVESKSLKLYLNSLNFARFPDEDSLVNTLCKDLAPTLGCHEHVLSCGDLKPRIRRFSTEDPFYWQKSFYEGVAPSKAWVCVDEEDVGVMPAALLETPDETHLVLDSCEEGEEGEEDGGDARATSKKKRPAVKESLVSHVLRTLCPVTGQPDWGSVIVEYEGHKISRPGLLKYICSLRREVGFHENAIERITLAIHKRCAPRELRVTGRFLRRGGIDINPVRAIKSDAHLSLSLGDARGATQVRAPGQ